VHVVPRDLSAHYGPKPDGLVTTRTYTAFGVKVVAISVKRSLPRFRRADRHICADLRPTLRAVVHNKPFCQLQLGPAAEAAPRGR
jgi:hypothetical protein